MQSNRQPSSQSPLHLAALPNLIFEIIKKTLSHTLTKGRRRLARVARLWHRKSLWARRVQRHSGNSLSGCSTVWQRMMLTHIWCHIFVYCQFLSVARRRTVVLPYIPSCLACPAWLPSFGGRSIVAAHKKTTSRQRVWIKNLWVSCLLSPCCRSRGRQHRQQQLDMCLNVRLTAASHWGTGGRRKHWG